MATSLKTACQAARRASQHQGHRLCQTSFRETAQGQCIRPNPTTSAPRLQRRAYTQSSKRAASTSPHQDTQYIQDDIEAPLPDEGDLSSTAHAELAQHREIREMTRLAAWEMPLLSALAKPFSAPNRSEQPLRWRYTTYFSDSHPASTKVVVEFEVQQLHTLSGQQQTKLRKLCGPRYNPETDSVKMSCESYDTQARNKRYLLDVVQRLIAESKDEADTFADVPLDVRHHKFKKVLRFPEEWNMTPERRAELEEQRRVLLLAEGTRAEEGSVVSGAAAIEAARQLNLQQAEEPVMASARQPLAKGKMGQREMGQKGR